MYYENDEMRRREFRRDMVDAVSKLDTEYYRKFHEKWTNRGYYNCPLPKDETSLMDQICRMALTLSGVANGRKKEAREWLRVHEAGYSLINEKGEGDGQVQ